VSQSTMNMFFAISGFGAFTLGVTVTNFRWRRIAEERDWDRVQAQAFRVRELFDRADMEHRKRVTLENDFREVIGDLLDKYQKLDRIIQRTRNKKINKIVRMSKGWRTILTEKIAFVLSLWPGGGDQTKIAWENWPIYSDTDRRVSVS
jgi:hypothetical protein